MLAIGAGRLSICSVVCRNCNEDSPFSSPIIFCILLVRAADLELTMHNVYKLPMIASESFRRLIGDVTLT